MSEKHARLSPSNHKWVYCPGSIREEAKYPDITNDAAIDGTGSHLLLEMCLDFKEPPSFWEGKIIGIDHQDKREGWRVKQDRIDRVKMALDYIERRKKELKEQFPKSRIEIETESRSNPGLFIGRDDWWGTVDITITLFDTDDEIQFIEVIDFKDGRLFVDIENNPQLMGYLIGKNNKASFTSKYPGKPLINNRITIIQPKSKIPIRYQDLNSHQSYVFLEKILTPAIRKTDDPNAPLIPDEKGGKGYCRWCKHRNNCEARKNQIIGGLKMFTEETNQKGGSLFEVIEQTFKDIETMDAETLSQMLDAKEAIEDIFKRAEEEATKRIENGDKVPGYAMQPGNSKREWAIDEEELTKKLRACKLKKDQIYISKLISPSQLMKHTDLTKRQKQRIENDYIKVTPGALKLKRVGHQESQDAVDMFGDIVKQCNTKLNNISFI